MHFNISIFCPVSFAWPSINSIFGYFLFLTSHLDLVGHDLADLCPQDLLFLLSSDSNELARGWRGQRRWSTLVEAIKLSHLILHGLLGLGVTLTNVPERGRETVFQELSNLTAHSHLQFSPT